MPRRLLPLIAAASIVHGCSSAPLMLPAASARVQASGAGFDQRQFPPEYLQRERIGRQTVDPPNLITTILSPTLGKPVRAGADGKLTAVVVAPKPEWAYYLVPSAKLGFLRETRYAPPFEEAKYAEIAGDDLDAMRALIAELRGKVETLELEERWKLASVPLGTAGEIAALELRAGVALDDGLYALVIKDGDKLADVQFNAVHISRNTSDDFKLIVAGDSQWGKAHDVVEAALNFVGEMNRLAEEENPPEFILFLGDVVDADYGSAKNIFQQLLAGADKYPLGYMQAWAAFAALKLPIYVIPGNHDGYRYDGPLGTRADGLLLYESTFGPTHYAFDRGRFRFLMLNSYDLPEELRTLRANRKSSSIFELLADKLNVLNWGGGMREPQRAWLERVATEKNAPTPLLFLHHDPRGTYPVMRPRAMRRPGELWDFSRYQPLSAGTERAPPALEETMPGFSDTKETHAGFYVPLRTWGSVIRSDDWFEKLFPPPARGIPGWARYQQGWHSNYVFRESATLASKHQLRELREDEEGIVAPFALLETIVRARVRAIFKAHDNRFARMSLCRGEHILAPNARMLDLHAREGWDSESLVLAAPLTVYHVADAGDADSDGHGYLSVEIRGDSISAREVALGKQIIIGAGRRERDCGRSERDLHLDVTEVLNNYLEEVDNLREFLLNPHQDWALFERVMNDHNDAVELWRKREVSFAARIESELGSADREHFDLLRRLVDQLDDAVHTMNPDITAHFPSSPIPEPRRRELAELIAKHHAEVKATFGAFELRLRRARHW